MDRAMKYSDLANLYLDVLNACADSAAEPGEGDQRGWMVREIERELTQINSAVLTDPQKPYSYEEFLQAVDGSGEVRAGPSDLRENGRRQQTLTRSAAAHFSGRP